MGRFAFPDLESEENTEAALAFESFARLLEARSAMNQKAGGTIVTTVAEQPATADLPARRLFEASQVRWQRWLYEFATKVGSIVKRLAMSHAGE